MLGPSGCGKSTTLRLVAGFFLPDKGQIYIRGEDVTFLPPYRRKTAMVFQDWALFPHMTVYQNVAFGLEMKKVAKAAIKDRTRKALELVRLPGFEDRFPSQLSGGQQQRIALARALVVEPAILLLDEPLSNLDAKLREEMRIELRELQKKLGITTVFVTHDQEEALTLSDRIALMRRGKLDMVAKPMDLYNKPATEFALDFVGKSNIFSGQLVSERVFRTKSGLQIKVNSPSRAGMNPIKVAIRPEKVILKKASAPGEENVFSGKVTLGQFVGSFTNYIIRLEGAESVLAQVLNIADNAEFRVGETVFATLPPEHVSFVNPSEEEQGATMV